MSYVTVGTETAPASRSTTRTTAPASRWCPSTATRWTGTPGSGRHGSCWRADAGSYAPVTILIQEMPDGGTRVAYDTVASAIAPYDDADATQVAERLDTEVLGLLHQATGVPAATAP